MKYEKSKKISKKIIEKESKKDSISVKVIPTTKLQNTKQTLKEELLNNKNNIQNLKKVITEIKDTNNKNKGICNYENNYIKIILDEIKKESFNKYAYLWELLTTTYHEYFHILMWYKITKAPNLLNFTLIIEELSTNLTNLYQTNNTSYYQEIAANIYGVKKGKEYLKHYPKIYDKLIGYIENDRLFYEIDLVNYDIEQFLNYLTPIIKNYPDKKFLFQDKYPYTIIKVLYNNLGIFKPLNTLFKEESWILLDKEIQYTIASSKTYLQSQNLNKLSKEELLFILDSLKYSYKKEINRYKQNKELSIQIEDFNKYVLPTLSYHYELTSKFNKKYQRNINKLKYLKKQIIQLNYLIKLKTNQKKYKRGKNNEV